MAKRPLLGAGLLALAASLAACQDGGFSGSGSTKHLSPIPPQTLALMSEKGMAKGDPILIRAYKKEAEMEVWKRKADGRYALLKTFPICRWSGQLGPKVREGDRQAPEGFYSINPGQMNPNSSYYLSFDTGFPNAYDRANNRTGRYLMVHGTCSSSGCFAMTDESISEIYAIARDAFGAGQRAFQFQSYPFRMTAQNIAKFRNDPNMPFWKNLKEGSDYFEVTQDEPRVGVCGKRYVFGGADAVAGSCTPQVEPQVAEKRERDEEQVAALVAKGTPAVRLVYEDGGQNPIFRDHMADAGGDVGNALVFQSRPRRNLGEVSRPDALAAGPREILIDQGGKPTLVADAGTATAKDAAGKDNVHRPTALAFAQPAPGSPQIPSREAARSQKAAVTGSTVAKQPPAPEPRPVAVTVADAGDDPSVYQRVFSGIFAKANTTPAAPPPVAAEPEAPAVTTTAAPIKTARAHTAPAAKPDTSTKAKAANTTVAKTAPAKTTPVKTTPVEGKSPAKPGTHASLTPSVRQTAQATGSKE